MVSSWVTRIQKIKETKTTKLEMFGSHDMPMREPEWRNTQTSVNVSFPLKSLILWLGYSWKTVHLVSFNFTMLFLISDKGWASNSVARPKNKWQATTLTLRPWLHICESTSPSIKWASWQYFHCNKKESRGIRMYLAHQSQLVLGWYLYENTNKCRMWFDKVFWCEERELHNPNAFRSCFKYVVVNYLASTISKQMRINHRVSFWMGMWF